MALASIPASVLSKLQKMFFNFLWLGCSDHHRQHLCGWHLLAKPKQKGGWGIQNLLLFSQALAPNSLWRALFLPGIWHSVIIDKYLCHHLSVVGLLRRWSFPERLHSSGEIFQNQNLLSPVGSPGIQVRGMISLLAETTFSVWTQQPSYLSNF
jgi:hypothetical protein